MTTGQLRIGTSGYQYHHWKGAFYPNELPQRRWFEYYSSQFDTVEINNSFYSLPKAATFEQWRQAAPPGFRYALKFSRFGSHIKRLRDPSQTIGTFLEAAEQLKSRLGPILVQLPPNWRPQPERLDAFLAAAPRRHRWVIECRDQRWLNDEVLDILRRRRAALCLHDMIEGHPLTLTADWTYRRFHGDDYAGSYSDRFLASEADRLVDWLRDGRDVYAYFNNDESAHAVHNALTLKQLVNDRL